MVLSKQKELFKYFTSKDQTVKDAY
jgi:hypothetical protein